ncbi:MAG: FHA domain-containing protein [Polyangiaceae bacterium]|nr:FHA domain-containing protein [Polyangiaceae bacterium]
MWKLSIEDDQGNTTVVNLVREEYGVGRAEENTIRLTERNISRKHARLRQRDGAWVIDDRESYNGVWVNGVRISGPERLSDGDLVQLGDYRLEVIDEEARRQAAAPRQTLIGAHDRLVMVAGPAPGTELGLTGERMLIGRGEECDLRVDHASVSRVHAEIQPLGDGRYELIDKESANGLRVNGAEMKRALLDGRDTVELGDVVLKLIRAGEIFVPGPDDTYTVVATGDRTSASIAPTGAAALPPAVKGVAAVLGLGALVVLGMLIFGSGRDEGPAHLTAPTLDTATRALADADALLAKGDVEGAYRKVTTEIGPESNARQSETFKKVVSVWADDLLRRGDDAADEATRRSLYGRVEKSEAVDAARRKRASDKIQALEEGVAGVDALPEARPAVDAAAQAPNLAGGIIKKNPFGDPGGAAAAPAGAAPPKEDDLGDRAALTRQKNALKAKVQTGKASDAEARMLRALCRQLGDLSCVN